MTAANKVYTVCPHCKRPVVALRDQKSAYCAEHGDVVPMRSTIANQPLRQPLATAQ